MTILFPEKFAQKPSADFDGVFDWDWTKGCFVGNEKLGPTDFDGVVHRFGQFLVFESKDPGKVIPEGQVITLNSLHSKGCVTVMLIWGKALPEYGQIWWPGCLVGPGDRPRHDFVGVDVARVLVSRWWDWASKLPPVYFDNTILTPSPVG